MIKKILKKENPEKDTIKDIIDIKLKDTLDKNEDKDIGSK